MKKKKPYRYVDLKDVVCAYTEKGKEHHYEFPATKRRKQFQLPWRVQGKGLKRKLV
ncbi:MAG: hypothetical protein LBB89_06540 [Treponema sp.]|jgi:hypothetical protein|nr:hypothetical protein [Treponema sp.]